MDWREEAPAIFVITGVFERIKKISGLDSSRFVYIEAGAAAENPLLEVISLGPCSTYTAGFDENKMREQLGLAREEVPLGFCL